MINLLLQATGSPLMARQNHTFYFVAIGGIIICSIFGIVWLILQMYQKMIKSEEYQNKQHNIPTSPIKTTYFFMLSPLIIIVIIIVEHNNFTSNNLIFRA